MTQRIYSKVSVVSLALWLASCGGAATDGTTSSASSSTLGNSSLSSAVSSSISSVSSVSSVISSSSSQSQQSSVSSSLVSSSSSSTSSVFSSSSLSSSVASSASSSSSSVSSSSASSNPGALSYEAEEASIFKGKIESEHAGFSGSGYVNYDNVNDSYVEWNFNVITLAVATSVELDIRYANGTNANRPLSITVNGVVVNPNVAFDSTGAWNNWQTKTISVSLAAGNNVIRATSAGASGGPNVDRIELRGNLQSGSSSSATSSSTSSSNSSVSSSVVSSSQSSSSSSTSSSNSSSTTSSSSSSSAPAQEVRAFPGAEGFAAMITGGRNGRVIKVTNLNASGAGSLRDALSQSGSRIIVFDVSGSIRIPGTNGNYGGILYVENGNVTIAGQTAPGGGITLEGRLYMAGVSNIIIRHLRIRPEYDGSSATNFDTVQVYQGSRVMMDHLSMSFGVDEIVDLWEASDISVQWSTIESADKNSAHPDGNSHNYGLLNGEYGQRVSVTNSLFAHNNRRNPAISNGPADIVNNVIYNVRHGFHHDDPAANNNNAGQFNIAGNYFKAGPSTSTLIPIWFWKENGDIPSFYYTGGNWTDTSAGNSQCPAGNMTNPRCSNSENNEYNNFTLSNTVYNFSSNSLWRAPAIKTASEAYTQVVAKVGAFPRDVVTRRTITELQAGTGAWGSRRDGLNMMDGLTPGTAPQDSDGDGMPDLWEAERAHLGLSPHIADHNTLMPSGYTAIEEYINQRADALLQ